MRKRNPRLAALKRMLAARSHGQTQLKALALSLVAVALIIGSACIGGSVAGTEQYVGAPSGFAAAFAQGIREIAERGAALGLTSMLRRLLLLTALLVCWPPAEERETALANSDRALNVPQVCALLMLGVLLFCPITLMESLSREITLLIVGGEASAAGTALPIALFIPSALLLCGVVPVYEELLFRRCMPWMLTKAGIPAAQVISAVLFAIAHGRTSGFAAYLALGLLLSYVLARTRSILAPILVHSCYNLTLLLLSGMGLSGFVLGTSLLSCAVRTAGCAGVIRALAKLKNIDAREEKPVYQVRLRRSDRKLMLCTSVLFVMAMVMSILMSVNTGG